MTNQEAISIIQTYVDVKSESEAEALDLAITALKNERPQGEWIPSHNPTPTSDRFKCSVCGHYKIFLIPKECQDYKNFCPNCGADMRGGAE